MWARSASYIQYVLNFIDVKGLLGNVKKDLSIRSQVLVFGHQLLRNNANACEEVATRPRSTLAFAQGLQEIGGGFPKIQKEKVAKTMNEWMNNANE